MRNAETKLTPSFLDRLVESCYSPNIVSSGCSESELISSIQKDIEDLLNARQTVEGLHKHPHLQHSILGFGLPDSSSFDLETPEAKRRLARTIEAIITEFEPRVSKVKVETMQERFKLQSLQFQIFATLKTIAAPVLIFETSLQLATGHYRIKTTQRNDN